MRFHSPRSLFRSLSILLFASFTFIIINVYADDLPKTLMTLPGKLLASDDFAKKFEAPKSAASKESQGGWHFAVGKWEVTEGVLEGTEQPADHHPAHAVYGLKYANAVIQFDVRLDGCKMTRWRATDAVEYLCSVRFTPDGVSLFKDDHDHTGPDKDELLGHLDLPMKRGEWHSVVVEIMGEEIVATVDGKSMAGSHALVGTGKGSLRFASVGGSAGYRKLRVWEALPNPEWGKNKAGLVNKKH